MAYKYCLILNTCPNQETAIKVANRLVEDKLAACVSIMSKMTSIYQWQGTLETSEEILLLIKTMTSNYSRVESTIAEMHPYELPEIISVPITEGSDQYLRWISDNTHITHTPR